MVSSGFSSSSSFRPAVEKTSPGMKASSGKGWGPGKSIHSSAKPKTLPLINADLTDQKGYKNSPRSHGDTEKAKPFTREDTEEHRDFKNMRIMRSGNPDKPLRPLRPFAVKDFSNYPITNLLNYQLSSRCFLFGEAGEELLGTLVHLSGREVFLMRTDAPGVAEGIDEASVAVAPELVSHGHALASAGRDGLLESGVNVRHVEVQSAGASAESLRRLDTHLRIFFTEKDDGVADFEFGVHDFAVGARHAHEFLCAEGFFIEIDGFGCVADDQAGSDRVESFRNRFLGRCHDYFSFL